MQNREKRMREFLEIYDAGEMTPALMARYGGQEAVAEIAKRFRVLLTSEEKTERESKAQTHHENPNPSYQKKVWQKLAEQGVGHMQGNTFVIDQFDVYLEHVADNFSRVMGEVEEDERKNGQEKENGEKPGHFADSAASGRGE